ncbi:phosphoadenosine phosphosulfate reductase domain-containing protein [Streptomyces lydicus]|uniref:phosphoadenosine phosphosulfate reductase domain-containing protein n=1 Tax=Streptomyces lydicus TaxID=47763 RepID=UPI0036E48488
MRILECIGQRAAESNQRAKLAEVEINRGASNGKRHVTTWRPIHAWSDRKVWREIARSRLPYHPAYDWGNRRLSCVFCVLGCNSDLVHGARRVPELAAAYARTEVVVGSDFKKGLSMAEIIRRAQALEAAEGPAARPPVGTAMAEHVGRAVTSKYRVRQSTLHGSEQALSASGGPWPGPALSPEPLSVGSGSRPWTSAISPRVRRPLPHRSP